LLRGFLGLVLLAFFLVVFSTAPLVAARLLLLLFGINWLWSLLHGLSLAT